MLLDKLQKKKKKVTSPRRSVAKSNLLLREVLKIVLGPLSKNWTGLRVLTDSIFPPCWNRFLSTSDIRLIHYRYHRNLCLHRWMRPPPTMLPAVGIGTVGICSARPINPFVMYDFVHFLSLSQTFVCWGSVHILCQSPNSISARGKVSLYRL